MTKQKSRGSGRSRPSRAAKPVSVRYKAPTEIAPSEDKIKKTTASVGVAQSSGPRRRLSLPRVRPEDSGKRGPDVRQAFLDWKQRHPTDLRKKVAAGPSTLEEYLAFLGRVYGTVKCRPQAQRSTACDPDQLAEVSLDERVSPNYAAFTGRGVRLQRLVPTHDGVATSIGSESSNATDIFIGLDFGTSCSKVVLRDANLRKHYAVPFFELGSGNPFLLPSRVFLDRSGCYSLDASACNGVDSVSICDLKLKLLQDARNVRYMVHAAAYLALVVRHSRGWLLSAYRDTYSKTEISWGLNLGLPAEKSEDEFLTDRFQALALAAANLAGDEGSITECKVASHLEVATRALSEEDPGAFGLTVWPDMVGVYPEIAAQVVAFVESERWDTESRPFILMIDIGAGTVDVSFFSVQKTAGRLFRFFKNKVAENGVVNLHRERVSWLEHILSSKLDLNDETKEFLKTHSQLADGLMEIPPSVSSYILGLHFSDTHNIDTMFFRARYRFQVFAEVLHPVHRCRVPNGEHWQALPVFICGGGSRMPLYREIVDSLNSIPGVNWLKVQRYYLTKPDQLLAPGLEAAEYDRLSVAYGLSFEKVGDIIRSHEIDDCVPDPLPHLDIEAPTKDVC